MGDDSAAVAFSTHGCKESGPGNLDVSQVLNKL